MIERTEVLQPEAAEALAGLLNVPRPDLDTDGVPLLWPWAYLLDRPAQAELGVDGHPRAGIPSPPEPGRRRMFAGGTVRRTGPLRCGLATTRRSRVVSTVDKAGRSGPMTFTTVEHELLQDGVVVVTDRQDIAYLTAVPTAPEQPHVEPAPPTARTWSVPVDPVLLFRFSALTYNSHRIHYDEAFARAEGHQSLVVHGPLQALAMATACAVDRPAVRSEEFSYRLVAPLYLGQGMLVQVDPASDATSRQARVTDQSARLTATGRWRSLDDPTP